MLKRILLLCITMLVAFAIWFACFALRPSLCPQREFDEYSFTHSALWYKAMEKDDLEALQKLNRQFFKQHATVSHFDTLLKMRRKAVVLQPDKYTYYLLGRHLLYYNSQTKPFDHEVGIGIICHAKELGSDKAASLIKSHKIVCP